MFQPSVAWDVFKMDVRYMALKKHCGDSYFWSCAREWLVVGLTQVVLRKFAVYVYIPHLFAQWAIVTMNLLQHDGCETEEGKTMNGIGSDRNIESNLVNCPERSLS